MRSLNFTARVAANSGVQVIGTVLASAISIFTFAAVTRSLGPAAFGHYAAAMAYLGVPIVLSDVGLSTAVLREISAHPDRMRRVIGGSVAVRSLISTGLLATATGIAFVISFDAEVRLAVAIGALGALFNLLNLSLMPALQAELKMLWGVIGTLIGRLVTLVSTLSLLAAGFGFAGVIWGFVAGNAAAFAFDLWAVRRSLRFRLVLDGTYWVELIRGSIVLGLAISLGQILWHLDIILLTLMRPAAEVGLYSAAYKFMDLAAIVATVVTISIFPLLTRLVADGDRGARALLQRAFDILVAAAVPLTVLTLVYSRQLVTLAGGSEFGQAAHALRLLAPLPVLIFVVAVFERAFVAAHHEQVLVALNGSVLVLNLALNLIFLPLYGFEAAAVNAVASEAVWLGMGAVLFRRLYGFAPSLRFLPVVAGGVAVMGAVLLAVPGRAPLVGAIATIAYGVTVIAFPGTGREVLGNLVRNLQREQVA